MVECRATDRKVGGSILGPHYLRNILGQDVYPCLSAPLTRCGVKTVTGGLACISCVRAEVAAMAGELTQISYLVASHRDGPL